MGPSDWSRGYGDGEEPDDRANDPTDLVPAAKALTAALAAAGAMVPDVGWLAPLLAGGGQAVMDMFDARQARAQGAVLVTLCEACHASSLTPGELRARCDATPRHAMLSGDVFRAAYESLYPAKLRALGRCLATGVTDDTRLDEEWVLARALVNLEEPHVSLLAVMADQDSGEGPQTEDGKVVKTLGHIWSETVLTNRVPALSRALSPILGVLVREGFVVTVAPQTYDMLDTGFVFYTATGFGRMALDRLRAFDGEG